MCARDGMVWGHREGAVEAVLIPSKRKAALAFVWRRSPEELGFWEAMLGAPADPLLRQIYADWLDEHGDPMAGCLRGDRAFVVRYLVSRHPQNARRANWALVAAEIRTLAGDCLLQMPRRVQDFYSPLRIARSDITRASGTGPDEWASRSLEIRLASGEPAPPFVNYLLLRTAGLGLNPFRR